MKRFIGHALVLSAVAIAGCSQHSSSAPSVGQARVDMSKPAADFINPHPPEILLWNGIAPGSEGQDSPDVINWRKERIDSFPVVTNINHPSITAYIPKKGTATGAAIVVAPGGGHQFLSINHEGYDVGRYLADHGVAAFVLKYRLARAPGSKYQVNVEPIMDARRAMRLIRSRANEWGVDPARVGIMGFSAGGEVAAQLVMQGEKPEQSHDEIDSLKARPDFQALIYPGQSNNIVVDKETPPAFLCCSFDDRPDIAEGLANVYLSFKKAGVNAELHIYNKGGHGFGIRPTPIAEATWPDRLLDWMKDRGYLHP